MADGADSRFRDRGGRRRVGRILGAISAAVLVITSAGLASASSVDTAVVDTTAPTGSVSLQPGQNASIQINLNVTGRQGGTATFTVNRNWLLSGGTFTGSNPETFTVTPRLQGAAATEFTANGVVSIASGQATGTKLLQIPAFDITNTDTPTLAIGNAASYSVDVVAPSDLTPPVITPNVSGTLGNGDWYTSNVSVSWSVNDAQSVVTSSTGCGSTTISTDTTGTALTCSATSGGGTASKSVTIKRDATAPTLTATPSPAPNDALYNNSAVDVSYTCSDSMSGLLLVNPCPATDQASTDGTHTFAPTIYDRAGNSSSVSTTVKIDTNKPTITGSRSPAGTWTNGDVTVTFTCDDPSGTNPSGIKSCVAGDTLLDHMTLSTPGANQSVIGTATDNADNTNTATVGDINIDKTLPVIGLASRTQANTHGWNNTGVTLTWNCTDLGGSGVVHETVTQTLAANGADQEATGTCEDGAGNTATNTVTGINIDTTPPAITFDNQAPGINGAGWNNTDVTVTWQCSDSVSDVVHAAVSEAVSTEGFNQSATGTCEDLAGNTASDTRDGINIDKTAPVVTGSVTTAIVVNGTTWYKDSADVAWSATDATPGSGVMAGSPTPTSATLLEGWSQSATATAYDNAGNVDTGSVVGINVDASPPTVTATIISTPAYNDWYKDSVDIAVSAADPPLSDLHAGSGLSTAPPGTVTRYSTGSYSTTVMDNVGHSTLSNSVTYKVDSLPPIVGFTTCPTGDVIKGSTATADWTASDGADGSGLVGASSGSFALDTSSVGSNKTATAPMATDNVGHTSAAATCSYRVVFDFAGFFQPIDVFNGDASESQITSSTIFNKAKAGSAIPVKFSLAGNQGLSIFESLYPKTGKVSCPSIPAVDLIEAFADSNASGLKYDATADQYNYTWKTATALAGTCQRLEVRLIDGTSHYAFFQFTK